MVKLSGVTMEAPTPSRPRAAISVPAFGARAQPADAHAALGQRLVSTLSAAQEECMVGGLRTLLGALERANVESDGLVEQVESAR
jgi:hypothetical protein